MADYTTALGFLQDVLPGGASSVFKGSQWVVQFENLDGLISTFQQATNQEPSGAWGDVGGEILQLSKISSGCVLAQAVELPGDSIVANPEGIMSNNYARDYVGQGRNAYPEFRVTFLETNKSVVENIMRPWVVATAAYGLWDDPDHNYRCDISVFKFYGDGPEISAVTFKNACCVGVGSTELNYTPHHSPITREARFIYQGVAK